MYDGASPMAMELLYLRGICCFAAVQSPSHMVLKLVLTEELKPFTISLNNRNPNDKFDLLPLKGRSHITLSFFWNFNPLHDHSLSRSKPLTVILRNHKVWPDVGRLCLPRTSQPTFRSRSDL